jgi:hypothetical protein
MNNPSFTLILLGDFCKGNIWSFLSSPDSSSKVGEQEEIFGEGGDA